MKKLKRTLALILSLAMVLTLLPMTAMAAGTNYTATFYANTNISPYTPTSASETAGSTVKFTAKVTSGYYISELNFKKTVDLSTVDIDATYIGRDTASNTETWQFKMPDYNVTVVPTVLKSNVTIAYDAKFEHYTINGQAGSAGIGASYKATSVGVKNTLTVAADSDYQIVSVKAVPVKEGYAEIELVEEAAGQYSFIADNYDVKIEVEVREISFDQANVYVGSHANGEVKIWYDGEYAENNELSIATSKVDEVKTFYVEAYPNDNYKLDSLVVYDETAGKSSLDLPSEYSEYFEVKVPDEYTSQFCSFVKVTVKADHSFKIVASFEASPSKARAIYTGLTNIPQTEDREDTVDISVASMANVGNTVQFTLEAKEGYKYTDLKVVRHNGGAAVSYVTYESARPYWVAGTYSTSGTYAFTMPDDTGTVLGDVDIIARVERLEYPEVYILWNYDGDTNFEVKGVRQYDDERALSKTDNRVNAGSTIKVQITDAALIGREVSELMFRDETTGEILISDEERYSHKDYYELTIPEDTKEYDNIRLSVSFVAAADHTAKVDDSANGVLSLLNDVKEKVTELTAKRNEPVYFVPEAEEGYRVHTASIAVKPVNQDAMTVEDGNVFYDAVEKVFWFLMPAADVEISADFINYANDGELEVRKSVGYYESDKEGSKVIHDNGSIGLSKSLVKPGVEEKAYFTITADRNYQIESYSATYYIYDAVSKDGSYTEQYLNVGYDNDEGKYYADLSEITAAGLNDKDYIEINASFIPVDRDEHEVAFTSTTLGTYDTVKQDNGTVLFEVYDMDAVAGTDPSTYSDLAYASAGDTVRVIVTADDGYTVNSIIPEGLDYHNYKGGSDQKNYTVSFTMPDRDVEVAIGYKHAELSISYAIRGYAGFTAEEIAAKQGTVDTSRVHAYCDDTVTLAITKEEGNLVEASVADTDGNEVALEASTGDNLTFVMPTKGVKATVTFILYKGDVIFDSNCTDAAGTMANQSYNYGVAQNLRTNAYTRAGYDFLGWSENQAATAADYADGASHTVNWANDGDTKTLYAVWKARTDTAYTVRSIEQNIADDEYTTYKADETRTGTTDTQTAVEAETRVGFHSTVAQTNINGKGDGVALITYDRNIHKVSPAAGYGAADVTEEKSYRFDATATVDATMNTGYVFVNWTDAAGNVFSTDKSTSFIVADQDYALTANGRAAKYTVSFNANGGSGTMADQAFEYDTAQKLTNNSFVRSGYFLLGWSRDKNAKTAEFNNTKEVKNLTFTDGDVVTLYAIWNYYGGSGTGGGSSSGGGGSSSGTAVAVAPSNTGLTFSSNWKQVGTEDWFFYRKNSIVPVVDAWLCDNAIAANGLNVWYLLGEDGKMVAAPFVQDASGNYYSLETNHNGYYGSLRYTNGTYDGIYMEFSQKHDGTFGAITNQSAIDALKAKYTVYKFGKGNESTVYSANER